MSPICQILHCTHFDAKRRNRPLALRNDPKGGRKADIRCTKHPRLLCGQTRPSIVVSQGQVSARSGLSWGIVVLQCSFPLAAIHAPRSILVGEMTAVRTKPPFVQCTKNCRLRRLDSAVIAYGQPMRSTHPSLPERNSIISGKATLVWVKGLICPASSISTTRQFGSVSCIILQTRYIVISHALAILISI